MYLPFSCNISNLSLLLEKLHQFYFIFHVLGMVKFYKFDNLLWGTPLCQNILLFLESGTVDVLVFVSLSLA